MPKKVEAPSTQIEVFDCAQGSEEWFRVRLGCPSSSMFKTVMASGKTAGAKSLTRRTYMNKLAGEIITSRPMENYSNEYMNRGKEMEGEARAAYAFNRADTHEIKQVGFIKRGRIGCSPDSLIGKSGMLEIKTIAPHILIETLFKGEMPPEHNAQTQGALFVAEREWIDFIGYFTSMPIFTIRKYRNETYIRNLEIGLKSFIDELDEIVAKIRRM